MNHLGMRSAGGGRTKKVTGGRESIAIRLSAS